MLTVEHVVQSVISGIEFPLAKACWRSYALGLLRQLADSCVGILMEQLQTWLYIRSL